MSMSVRLLPGHPARRKRFTSMYLIVCRIQFSSGVTVTMASTLASSMRYFRTIFSQCSAARDVFAHPFFEDAEDQILRRNESGNTP